MCWIGYKTDRRIATKDIKCRKIIAQHRVSKQYQPYYRNYDMDYVFGRTYTGEPLSPHVTFKKTGEIAIYEGFHSYSLKTYIKKAESPSVHEYEAKVGNNTFSFWRTMVRVPVLVECTIPKGSVYYENQYGEIVSDHIRLNKEITL